MANTVKMSYLETAEIAEVKKAIKRAKCAFESKDKSPLILVATAKMADTNYRGLEGQSAF